MGKFMEGYLVADYLAITISAVTLWRCYNNGVPWYICLGMYGLIALGIDAVIDDEIKAKKEKASKAKEGNHASKA